MLDKIWDSSMNFWTWIMLSIQNTLNLKNVTRIVGGCPKAWKRRMFVHWNILHWLIVQSNMWMCQINHQFSPTKPRCWFWYVRNAFSFQCTNYDVNRWLNTKLGNTFFSLPKCKVVYVRWYLTKKEHLKMTF